MKSFFVSIITPREVIWEGEAISLRAPGALGNFGVWANHAPMITGLEGGEIVIRPADATNSAPVRYNVNGGFLQVLDNNVIALPDKAEKIKI